MVSFCLILTLSSVCLFDGVVVVSFVNGIFCMAIDYLKHRHNLIVKNDQHLHILCRTNLPLNGIFCVCFICHHFYKAIQLQYLHVHMYIPVTIHFDSTTFLLLSISPFASNFSIELTFQGDFFNNLLRYSTLQLYFQLIF